MTTSADRLRHGRRLLISVMLVAAGFTLGWCMQAFSAEAYRVVDGDTLEIGVERIRLFGIDAPERTARPETRTCGVAARRALISLITIPPVCTGLTVDHFGRTVAICTSAGVDLSRAMVQAGWAADWPRYSRGRYLEAQVEARRIDGGIWRKGVLRSGCRMRSVAVEARLRAQP